MLCYRTMCCSWEIPYQNHIWPPKTSRYIVCIGVAECVTHPLAQLASAELEARFQFGVFVVGDNDQFRIDFLSKILNE